MDAFRWRGMSLFDAIDALKASDGGALDSGVADEDLRSAVLDYLRSLPGDDLRVTCGTVARRYLSDEALRSGYGVDDVLALVEWLRDQGVLA